MAVAEIILIIMVGVVGVVPMVGVAAAAAVLQEDILHKEMVVLVGQAMVMDQVVVHMEVGRLEAVEEEIQVLLK